MNKTCICLLVISFISQILASPINQNQGNVTSSIIDKIATKILDENTETFLGFPSTTSVSNDKKLNIFDIMRVSVQLILRIFKNSGARFINSILMFVEQQKYQIIHFLNINLSISIDSIYEAVDIITSTSQILALSVNECISKQRIIYQKAENRTINNLISCGMTNIQEFVNIIDSAKYITELGISTFTNVINQLVSCENISESVIDFGFCANIIKNSLNTISTLADSGISLVIDASIIFQNSPTKFATCAVSEIINYGGMAAKIISEVGKCTAVMIQNIL